MFAVPYCFVHLTTYSLCGVEKNACSLHLLGEMSILRIGRNNAFCGGAMETPFLRGAPFNNYSKSHSSFQYFTIVMALVKNLIDLENNYFERVL